MIPFCTTEEQIARLESLILTMKDACLAHSFITRVGELARVDQGIFDLVELWCSADAMNRVSILADLQNSINDYDNTLRTRVAELEAALKTAKERQREACAAAIPTYEGSDIGWGAGLEHARERVRATPLVTEEMP